MSAQWRAAEHEAPRLAPLTIRDLDALMKVENTAYAYPWTRGNFIDSLAAGYAAWQLVDGQDTLLGYFIAMPGAQEMHLLNLTVAPPHQGQGHARGMLDALAALCRDAGLPQLWLEVRASNMRARALYARFGLIEVGRRKAYYPAQTLLHPQRREDAVVMSLQLDPIE